MADTNPALKYRKISDLPPHLQEAAQKMQQFLRDLGGVQQLPPSLRKEVGELLDKKQFSEAAKKLAGAGYQSVSDAVSAIATQIKSTADQTGAETVATETFRKAADGTWLGYGIASTDASLYFPQLAGAAMSDIKRLFAGDGMEKVRYDDAQSERITAAYMGAYHERLQQSKTTLEQPKGFFNGVSSQPAIYLLSGLHYLLQYPMYVIQYAASFIGLADKPEAPKDFRDLVGQSLLDNAQGTIAQAAANAKQQAAKDVVDAGLTSPAVAAILEDGKGAVVVSRANSEARVVENGPESVGNDGAIEGQAVASEPYKTVPAIASGGVLIGNLIKQGITTPAHLARGSAESFQDGQIATGLGQAGLAVGSAKVAQKTAPLILQNTMLRPAATMAGWFTEQGVTDRQVARRAEKARNLFADSAMKQAGIEAAAKADADGLDAAAKKQAVQSAKIEARTAALKESEHLLTQRQANPNLVRQAYKSADDGLSTVRDFQWIRPSARYVTGKASDATKAIISPLIEGARDVRDARTVTRAARVQQEVKAASDVADTTKDSAKVAESAAKPAAKIAEEAPGRIARTAAWLAERSTLAARVITQASKVTFVGKILLPAAIIAVPAVALADVNEAKQAVTRGELPEAAFEEYRIKRGLQASEVFDPTLAVSEGAAQVWFNEFSRKWRLSPELHAALDPTFFGTEAYQEKAYGSLSEAGEMPEGVRQLMDVKKAIEASRQTVEVPVVMPEYYGPPITQTELQDGPQTAELKKKFETLFAATLRDTAAKDYPQTIAYLDALAAGKKPEEALAAAKAVEEAAKTKPVAVAPGAEVKMGAVVQEAKPAEAAPKDEQKPDADRFAQILMEAANAPRHNPTILATGSAPDGAPVRPLAAGPRLTPQPTQLGG